MTKGAVTINATTATSTAPQNVFAVPTNMQLDTVDAYKHGFLKVGGAVHEIYSNTAGPGSTIYVKTAVNNPGPADIYQDDWEDVGGGNFETRADVTDDSSVYGLLASSWDKQSNRFAEAYIQPMNLNDNSGFQNNTQPVSTRHVTDIAAFNTSRDSADGEHALFWISYFSTAFEFEGRAGDGSHMWLMGLTEEVTPQNTGHVSVIFAEVVKDRVNDSDAPTVIAGLPESDLTARAAVHEIAHQFNVVQLAGGVVGHRPGDNLMNEDVAGVALGGFFFHEDDLSYMREQVQSPGIGR